MPPYTKRVLSLPEYPLGKIPARKRELIAQGMDVIDLGAGDADLAAPAVAIERIQREVQRPEISRYGFALGLMEYRAGNSVGTSQGSLRRRIRIAVSSKSKLRLRTPMVHLSLG